MKFLFRLLLLTIALSGVTAHVWAQGAPVGAEQRWVGKAPLGWTIARGNWMNTMRPAGLKRFRGRVTVLEFFRIECSHCAAAAPSRIALWTKYRPRGLRYLAFQSPVTPAENNWPMVRRTVRRWGLPYPVAMDRRRALMGAYGLTKFPTVLVIDRKGIVRFAQAGYTPAGAKALEAAVSQALSKK